MLSSVGKSALVVCSLAPVSAGCAILYVSRCDPDWKTGGLFLGCGILAALLSVGIIRLCGRRLQKLTLTITKVKPADKEALSFLVIYLLPLSWRDNVNPPTNWLIGGYVLLIMIIVIAHSNSFTFNPVLSLCRYHFYEVEDGIGGCFILVSKKAEARAQQKLSVVQLAPGVFLDKDP